jgi:hypothetical protein
MPKKSARILASVPSTPRSSACNQTSTLNLVREGGEAIDMLEPDRVCFDPDDDLEAHVPMPSSIPPRTRPAITQMVGGRFEYAEDLDTWLHAPNGRLKGLSPFECIVAGEGELVLNALADGVRSPELVESADAAKRLKRELRLVR